MVPAPRRASHPIVYKSQKITVIIPCLNEEQGIEKVLSRMPEFVDQTIVVDNGSTDRTSDVARSFGAEVIREPVRGYGRSYKRGFASAIGDIIITLDGDHSYPPDAISYLIEALLHLDVDFLNASRFPVRDRQAMSFKHKFGNWILSLAMSMLYFRWVRDSQSGMWVFRRSILKGMKLTSNSMAFSEEIKIEALKNSRIRFAEISIMYTSRLGEIKLNPWRDGFYNLWFLVRSASSDEGRWRTHSCERLRARGRGECDAAAGAGQRVAWRASPSLIPNWNGAQRLAKLFDCLARQSHAIQQVIVVDNGSADESVQIAARAGANGHRTRRQYRLQPRGKPRDPGGAIPTGSRSSTTTCGRNPTGCAI